MQLIYDPDRAIAVDEINPQTGRGVYGGRTLAQVREEHPRAFITDSVSALHFNELRACTPAAPISEADAMYLLEVLPPCGWHRLGSSESFYMSEFQTGRVTLHVVRIGAQWYSGHAVVMRTHSARVAWVMACLAEAEATEAPARLGMH